jgi:class 3 adenylate cyclase
MPIAIPFLIQSLCGGIVLLALDQWLRHKAIKGSSLKWLGISLLSWAAARVLELSSSGLGMAFPSDLLLYLFSPVSSILFTMTAFRLTPVQQLFHTKEARPWARIVIITVIIVSAIACILLLLKQEQVGKYLDAIASSLALITLGLALIYSFHRYGHQFLVWLTGMTFLGSIARQFYIASFGFATDNNLAPFHLANCTLMIMLFIALAVAWGLSDTSRLKTVGISANVNVVAVFFDLRGSTQWANEVVEKDFHHVRTFIDELREWAWNQAAVSPLGQPTFVKFLGDGFMLIWEVPDASVSESVNAGVRLGYFLHKHYTPWVRRKSKVFPWGVPIGLGVGVDTGPAIRLTFENGSHDYLGAPLSNAAKMQHLARPRGGVVIQEKVACLLNGFRSKFPLKDVLKIGDGEICVRMTGE